MRWPKACTTPVSAQVSVLISATNRIISSTLLAQWLLKQSPSPGTIEEEKTKHPREGICIGRRPAQPEYQYWGGMTTPTIDGAAESLKLELAKYLFLDKIYMFGKISFAILTRKKKV